MAEDNKYTIVVKTEGTSDPEEIKSIDKSIGSPLDAVKNQDELRKRIDSLASGASKESPDWKAAVQLSTKLGGVLKNTVRNAEVKTPTSKTKISDSAAKELKEAAADTKDAAKDLKDAAVEIKQGAKEEQKGAAGKGVSVAAVVPKKTTPIKKTAVEQYDENRGLKQGIKYKPGTTQEDVNKYLKEGEDKAVKEHNERVAKINQRRRKTQQTQQRADEPPWQGEETYPVDQQTTEKPKKKDKPRKWDWVAPGVQKTEAEAAREKKERAEQPKIPARRATGEGRSLVESSDALMSQIKSDFAKFKERLASTIRTRLQTEHAGGFQVVEGKGGAYTRRGGTEVLKIANMDKLINALLRLTESEKDTMALAEQGPAAMIEHASDVVAKEMIGKLPGKKEGTQHTAAVRQTVDYINKHGYEGSNEAIKALVKGRAAEERGTPLGERKGISVKQFNEVMAADAAGRGVEPSIRPLFAETVAREEINRNIGKSIQEVSIPRPVEGPQGLPAMQMKSGGYRTLSPEYEFTPGILEAGKFAGQLIKAGGKDLPDEVITDRLQRTIQDKGKGRVSNIKQMMVKDDVGGMAAHASDIMEVLKTDKKGRLELISAYRTVLGKKGEKIATEKIPETKKGQLEYLDRLGAGAKKCSLGFDDVIVAMGKLTKSNIYERLLGSLTTEGVGGKSSPVRTTMRDIGVREEAVDQFNKRIGEVFVQQEVIDPSKTRSPYYQSKVSKLISPKLTAGGPEDFVSGEDTRSALTALNKQTEQFLSLTGDVAAYPEKLTSQGVGESRAPTIKPDPRDASRIITNAYTTDIREEMPLGEWSNFGRTVASVYQGIGGAKAAGGVMGGGLEMSRLQSQRGRDLEKSGMWGEGYGLNLQTVMADSAGTFEDQIEIAGKAVNRFSEYIKPKIKDVKDVGSADVVAQDIVKSFAPAIGEQLRMKEPGKAGDDQLLISEISKILTSKTGASLDQQAVSVIERIFTALGTKMTTHAGSKGTVTFKKGEEGELGYTKRPTFTHDLMSQMLEKKKGKSPERDVQISEMQADLKRVGTTPFVDFMNRDLPKKVQTKLKEIRKAVLEMLKIDTSLTNEKLINEVNKMAKKSLGGKALTKTIPNEVRMSLTGAVKRLNIGEPLEAMYNNIAGEVDAIAPKTADLSPGGEVSRVLGAMGYGYGPEKDPKKRTLPMYSEQVYPKQGGKGTPSHAIAGSKFWQYTREPSQEAEWGKEDIWSGRKGQKMNIAAMGAITSMFGEKSPVTREAKEAYMPETPRAAETILSLSTLGDKPKKDIPKDAYIATKGLKELPGVIEKYEDLRDTILDPKFSAGGYADIPEFGEKGKEIGKRALYIPSRAGITSYEAEGEGLGANTLATRYGSLLANVEKYKEVKGRKFLETDKPDMDVLRKNVGTEIGKSLSSFRKDIGGIFKSKDKWEMGKGDTTKLISFLEKLNIVLSKMSKTEIAEKAPGIDRRGITQTIGAIKKEVTGKGTLPQKGGGLGQAETLLRTLKDVVIEPKVDVENIERAQKDLRLLQKGGSFADLSKESYIRYKGEAVSKTKTYEAKKARGEKAYLPDFGEKDFEEESFSARDRIEKGLETYIGKLSYGVKSRGALSASEGALMEGAKRFGVTTDPREQALEESRKNIEADKRRLGEELVKTTVGKEKGMDILQTRRIPAIRGQFHAAVNDKVDDFKEAIQILNSLGESGLLKDTGIAQSVEGQLATHKEAIEKERDAGGVVLKEGEVGMHAARIEKLTGKYGKGRTALDVVREGKEDITAMTTRFPYTGFSSMQFGKIKESTHPAGRNVISMAGAAPALDAEAFANKEGTGILDRLGAKRTELIQERSKLTDAEPGTPAAKAADAEREKLTIHINKLSKAIDLLTVKFHGFAQNMDTDGDHVNVHTARTKKAAQEIEKTAKDYSKGTFGKTLDPRAFINKMMSYNIAGEKSSMAELAGLYEGRADVPGAKIFQTPDITKEMKGMKMPAVMAALLKEDITPEKLDEIVSQKGLKGPEATEKTARGLLYDKVRTKQLEKIYVKSGIGENTEAINKTARFLEASVGFGEKQVKKEEYAGWKEKSVALGAVYDKGGKLTQRALPAREMQTMMNVMLEQVINAGMRGTKHGTGGRMYKDLTKGLAFGDLFQEMQGDERFKDILKANEIIKQTIRNRLDALNTVDFAAETKRHDLGKGKKQIKGRKAITEALVDRFSFEGFSKDMSKDIQNQALEVIKERHKRRDPKAKDKEIQASAEKELTTSLRTGEFDIASYFPEMQPKYMLRTSSASIDSLAKKSSEGKTKLDKAMHRVLSVVRSSGTGTPLSDTLVQSSFGELFNMFETTERLGKNVGKIFKKDRTLKQKEADVSGLEKRFGIARMPVKETEMLMAEAREQHIKEFPDAKEDTIQAAERKAVIKSRQTAVKRQVAMTRYKKDLLLSLSPEFGESYAGYKEVVEKTRVPIKPPKKPPMPPQGKRSMFGGRSIMGVSHGEWGMSPERAEELKEQYPDILSKKGDIGYRIRSMLKTDQAREQEPPRYALTAEETKKQRIVNAKNRVRAKRKQPLIKDPYPIYDIDKDYFAGDPYTLKDDRMSYALNAREIKSRALIHSQTVKQATGREGVGAEQLPKIPKIPRGKTSDVDYSIFGVGPAKDFVKVLEKYRIALGKLSEGAEDLTKKQKAKAEEALRFVERHRASLASIPEGAKGRKAAADVLSLSDKVKGIKREPTTPAGVVPTEKKPSPYKSKLEALVTMVTKAEAATGFDPKGMPSELMDIFSDIRAKRTRSTPAHQTIRELMDIGDIAPERRKSVWAQYHVEKVKAHSTAAQKADKEKDYATKEESIRDAKKTIARTWGSSLSPFLTRDRPGGRVTGQIDEDASAMLGLRSVGVEKKQIYDTAAIESPTAALAMKPLLFGTERMESRLKETWAILRKFNPEMAKIGEFSKAFNFETAKQDIAVIIEGLYKLKASSFNLTPEESADVKHAIKKTTEMQKALEEPGKTGVEKILPTVALPGLESRETALAAWENLQAKTMEDMMSEAAIEGSKMVPKVSRKIAMDVPTEGGLIEKKRMTLVARGDQAYGAAGKVVGIRKIDEKSTIEEPGYQPSRRSLRLFEQFSKSTGSLKNRIRDAYLGVKRFSSATGEVNFDEALSDLKDLQILIAATLKMPGLTREEGFDLKHLGKKMSYAHKTLSEVSPEGMPGVVMKDMETTKSALTAFKEQRGLMREALMETEGVEPGMSTTVAATIPTPKGPIKQKVKLVVEGDPEGRVTGVREERYKPKKRFVDELLEGKTSRGASLFKSFMEGTGNTNKRISDMLLGVKRFNMEMIKSGRYADAVNFDEAEEDLIEMIALFDKLLKGSTTLTDQERERCTMARTAAKEMKTKVIKTPVGARRGITMAGYETPESSIAAHQADIETRKRELLEKGELGRTATVVSKIMTKSGQEETRKTKLTTRGDRWFGFGGRAAKVTERDESPQGQTGSVLRRVAMWGSASGIIYGIIGGVRSMLETMKVAETGMVNLQKVMPRVGTDFDKMRDSAIGFAKTYGAELKGVLETMRIFAQQGLPQPQVLELTRVSTLAANVTTMDPTKSAEALTSATRQFNIEGEDAIKILDSWNEVENKFAITAADLADGFKKAGTAARITGIDVHKLNGIITAIGEATRQTGKEVGTSLKFIFSRMATEKAPRALSAVGVETMSGGRLREGSDILDDLAAKWVGLTRSQKLATAQAIGGIRHYNALMVLMANYDRALSATAASINSVGSAEKENKMVMATYAKQLAQTKASFDSLAVSTGGTLLPVLKLFTKTLRGIIDIVNTIPAGGLGALVMGSYAAATGLGKYFDLSMFGLLGERGPGGEKRKRTMPWEWGPTISKKYGGAGKAALGKDAGVMSSLLYGVTGARERKIDRSRRERLRPIAPPKIDVSALDKVKKAPGIAFTKTGNALKGVVSGFKTAGMAALGFLTTLGLFAKIAIGLAALAAAAWGVGKAIGATFKNAGERTKDYAENLEIVEATMNDISSIRLLSAGLKITSARIETLKELSPKQVAAQVEGRSYKSPVLMMKRQQSQVQEYANAVSAITTTGTYGFDEFGNAIISTTEKLGGVVSKLEEIATKSMIELKLHIIGEQLKDLTELPEIDGIGQAIAKSIRDGIRSVGKFFGADWMKGSMNTYEKMAETTDNLSKLRRKAASEGRTIVPPDVRLKKTRPDEYKKRNEEFKEYAKLNTERISNLKEFDEGFAEAKRNFLTIKTPGLTAEMAGQAATSSTAATMAMIEERRSPFYKARGVGQEDIMASYFHKLLGARIGPTAEITRETAMEQGIMPRMAATEEERLGLLGGARARDIMFMKKGARFEDEGGEFGIQSDQVQLFESEGELMVGFMRKATDNAEAVAVASVITKKEFDDIKGVSKNINEVISSVGMIGRVAQQLRDISIRPTGAEAGMFKPTTAKKLDLGKRYISQIDTGMLIQNNAFKSFSKGTEGFVNEYTKKQGELRRSQKAALDVYGKRSAISNVTSMALKKLSLELAGVANTAIQVIRATTEMEKSFAGLSLRFKEQAAIREAGYEVKKHVGGYLAGKPIVAAPKVETRKFSELSPHERLRAVSPEYEENLMAYDRQLMKYNKAVKEVEVVAKTSADIEYVKEEAGRRGSSEDVIAELAKSTALTGSRATGPLLNEASQQTALQHQMVSHLAYLVNAQTGGKMSGIALAEETMTKNDFALATKYGANVNEDLSGRVGMDVLSIFSSDVKNKEDALRAVTKQVSSDIGTLMSQGDLAGLASYRGKLEESTGSKEYTDYSYARGLLEAGAGDPEIMRSALTSAQGANISTTDYEGAAASGKLGNLIIENLDGIESFFNKVSGRMFETQGEAKEGATTIDSSLKKEATAAMDEEVEKVASIAEAKKKIAQEELKRLSKYQAMLERAQKAMKGFTIIVGGLEKAIESLAESFLKLDKQSMINKALIDTRAKYRSTRGGPMERQAPSVDVDVSTTAQYRPHQLLYEQSAQYKSATTGYLKNMEDVKTARSKLEELSKIEAQKEFLGKQPGVKKEDVDSFVSAAMRTGSVEIAPIVVELAKLNKTASSIDDKTVELKDGKPVTGEQQKSGEEMLSDAKRQAEADNRRAEMLAKRSADYMRKAQIRKQTDIEIATGSGKSQDQINKEESGLIASIGYVPSEIKERNQRLRAEYEKEKKARAEFELNKQRMLKPLQQAAGGMGSIISSIQTGVAGIEGGRNVRPLEEDFTQWAQGRTEEDVAEARGQFDLAKSIYSQNLSLRAQGADTGVAPRKLYDIMERASKGEDVTEELKAIESVLAEKKEEKEEQIRKIQAQEYAKAMSSSEGTKKTNTELSAINENTRTMVGALNEVASAIKTSPKTEGVVQQAALEKEKTQKTLQAAKDTGGVLAGTDVEKAPITKADTIMDEWHTKAADYATGALSALGVPVAETEELAGGGGIFGAPAGKDTVRDIIPGLVGREDYLLAGDERKLPEAPDLSFGERAETFVKPAFEFAKSTIPTVEKTVAEEPGQLTFPEKITPFLPGVLGQGEHLLASDEQREKSQMAAALSMPFEEKGKPFVETDFGYADRLKEAGKTEEEIKKEEMIKSAAKGGLTMTLPKEGESVEELGESRREYLRDHAFEGTGSTVDYGKDRSTWGVADKNKSDEELRQSELKKMAGGTEEKTGLIVTRPESGESASDFEARMAERVRQERTIDVAKSGLEITPESEEAKKVYGYTRYDKELSERKGREYYAYSSEPLTDEKMRESNEQNRRQDAIREQLERERQPEKEQKAAGLKEERKETKELKEKSLKETEQGKESRKEGEKLNKEVSDLKDEVEKLKTTITDVNKVFGDLSDSAGNIVDLGTASKDSASQIDAFGKSIFTASSSLDIFSSKASTATAESNEQGPTMVAEEVDFNFISEEDAINLVNFTKGELLENINNIDNTELLDSLVEKTDIISKDVASIKEGVTVISDTISEEDFNTFKEKALKYFEEVDKIKDIELDKLASSTDFDDLKTTVADYIETVGKLEKLTDTLADTSSSHSISILDLEKAFDLVSNELRDYNEKFTKFESSLGSMDHKFTTLIDDLKEDVGEVMNLAWAARSLASQNI